MYTINIDDFDFEKALQELPEKNGKPKCPKNEKVDIKLNGKDFVVNNKIGTSLQGKWRAAEGMHVCTYEDACNNLLSIDEVLARISEEDPNAGSDAAYYAHDKVDYDAVTEIDDDQVHKALYVLTYVATRLSSHEVLEKILDFAPKKKDGKLSKGKFTRIACGLLVDTFFSTVLQIVGKAASDSELVVSVEWRPLTFKEIEEISKDFISLHPEILTGESVAPKKIKTEGSKTAPVLAFTQFRCDGFVLNVPVDTDEAGEKVLAYNGALRFIDEMQYVSGSVEHGFDVIIPTVPEWNVNIENSVTGEMFSVKVIDNIPFGIKGDFKRTVNEQTVREKYKGVKITSKKMDEITSYGVRLADKHEAEEFINEDPHIYAGFIISLTDYLKVYENLDEQTLEELIVPAARKKDGTLFPGRRITEKPFQSEAYTKQNRKLSIIISYSEKYNEVRLIV